MNKILNPLENIKEFFLELYTDFANMAFKWLDKFMLNPTDLTKYEFVDNMQRVMLVLGTSLGVLFMMVALFKIKFQKMGGMQSRSGQEVIMKTSLATLFSISAPWLFTGVLLKLCNFISQIATEEGLSTKSMEDFTEHTTEASIAVILTTTIFVFLFVVLLFQYTRRLGESLILIGFSSLAAFSLINDEFNVFPAWWREAVVLSIQQPFQVWSLWLAFNFIGDGKSLEDYCIAIGAMSVVLTGPGWLRQILYSTGAGRSIANAAGGTSKMVIMKWATKRLSR
jgi:hypothetical protein